MTVRGHVRSGRLVVDVPTDLPEGTEVVVSFVDAVEVITAESVVERAGELVGSLEGPGDLSTAARHMAEYGR